MSEEKEIYINDMLSYIMHKWRLILAGMLAFAILLGGYGYFENASSAKAQEEEIQNIEAETASEEIQEEIDTVRQAAVSYTAYQKIIDETQEYLSNSVLMQLDANKVPSVTLLYRIDNGYEVVYPSLGQHDVSGDIANQYIAEAQSGELMEAIRSAAGVEIEDAYLAELITAEYTEPEQVEITVNGRNEEECRAIASAVRSYLESCTSEIQNAYGDFTFSLTEESYSEVYRADIMVKRADDMEAVSTASDGQTALLKKLTTDEQTMLNKVLENPAIAGGDYSVLADETVVKESIEEMLKDNYTASSGSAINVKYIAIGLILGAFLVCAVLAVKYILSGAMHTEKDIEDQNGASLIGVLYKDRKTNSGIDAWLDNLFDHRRKLFTDQERKEMLASSIRILSQKKELSSLYLCSSTVSEPCVKLINELQETLSRRNITVQTGKPVIYDLESLETMSHSDGVILVEAAEESRTADIAETLEKCRQYNVPVLGYITIK